MTNTVFYNQQTVIKADWLNDINKTVYEALGNGIDAPPTKATVLTNLGIDPASFATAAQGALADTALQPSSIGVTVQGYDAGTLTSAAIGVTVQGYDATTAKTDEIQDFSLPQRSTPTTDNDLIFSMAAKNNFTCTPTAGGALSFTDIAAGQSGYIILVNGSNYAITKASAVKADTDFLTKISATGTYMISYYSPDGVNVYVATTGALS